MRRAFILPLAAAISLSVTATAPATVTEFEDFAEWQAAAGEYTTISFTEVPAFSIVTTQYVDVRVTFVDGLYQTITTASGFPQDGFGLD